MDFEQLRAYCLAKKKAVETFPFGADVHVYKVMDKMFALLSFDKVATLSLKCEPTWAQILRQTHPAVQPGYHLNKEHWNSITCDDSISPDEIWTMIDHSYDLIVKSLPRKLKLALDESG